MAIQQLHWNPIQAPRFVDPYEKAGSLFNKAIQGASKIGDTLAKRDYEGAKSTLQAALAQAKTPEEVEAIKAQIGELPGSKYLDPGAAMVAANQRTKSLNEQELTDFQRKLAIKKLGVEDRALPEEEKLSGLKRKKELSWLNYDIDSAEYQQGLQSLKDKLETFKTQGDMLSETDKQQMHIIQNKINQANATAELKRTAKENINKSIELDKQIKENKQTIKQINKANTQSTVDNLLFNALSNPPTKTDGSTDWDTTYTNILTKAQKQKTETPVTRAMIQKALLNYNTTKAGELAAQLNLNKQDVFNQTQQFNEIVKQSKLKDGKYDIPAIQAKLENLNPAITTPLLQDLSQFNLIDHQNKANEANLQTTIDTFNKNNAHNKALKAATTIDNKGNIKIDEATYITSMNRSGFTPDADEIYARKESGRKLKNQEANWAALDKAQRDNVIEANFKDFDSLFEAMKEIDNEEALAFKRDYQLLKNHIMDNPNEVAVQDFLSKGGMGTLKDMIYKGVSAEGWDLLDWSIYNEGEIEELKKIFGDYVISGSSNKTEKNSSVPFFQTIKRMHNRLNIQKNVNPPSADETGFFNDVKNPTTLLPPDLVKINIGNSTVFDLMNPINYGEVPSKPLQNPINIPIQPRYSVKPIRG